MPWGVAAEEYGKAMCGCVPICMDVTAKQQLQCKYH